ncbi:MAG TPA: hypothetical protein DCQ64_01690 [Candidatus Rokubacteria bacterium]|nr:hypothetical protein [Candidatus Rokubacteria bacterium]
MRFGRLIILGLVVLLAGAAAADDTVTIVLGTGSPTGTTTAVQPHATAVGKWIQVTGSKTDETYLTFQLSGGASVTIVIQATMDGTTVDTVYTFTASGQIYTVAAPGGTVFRAVCTAFTSGSPVVTASASGRAQLTVLP